MHRVRHVLLILTGRASREALAWMEYQMAFEKTQAALDELKATATAIVAEVQAGQGAVANVDAADASIAQQISDVNATLAAVIPPPPAA